MAAGRAPGTGTAGGAPARDGPAGGRAPGAHAAGRAAWAAAAAYCAAATPSRVACPCRRRRRACRIPGLQGRTTPRQTLERRALATRVRHAALAPDPAKTAALVDFAAVGFVGMAPAGYHSTCPGRCVAGTATYHPV